MKESDYIAATNEARVQMLRSILLSLHSTEVVPTREIRMVLRIVDQWSEGCFKIVNKDEA